MGKLWGVFKHHWGKTLITALLGVGLTAAGLSPVAVGILAKAGGEAVQDYADEKNKEGEALENVIDGNHSGGRSDGQRRNTGGASLDKEGQPADAATSAPTGAPHLAGSIRARHLRGLAAHSLQDSGLADIPAAALSQLLEHHPTGPQLPRLPGFPRVDIVQPVTDQPEVVPGITGQHTEHPEGQHLRRGGVDAGTVGPTLGSPQASAGKSGRMRGRNGALVAGTRASNGHLVKSFIHNPIPLDNKTV
ncbi:hypothetical protein [Alcanivorax sp.]|uniref:hypothetical protein n=1 Tax=Alcanivorax sp. TaxID=1872427 RepID=UPI0025C67B16|nr:hypothetical protein [Alcanivorax sp.]